MRTRTALFKMISIPLALVALSACSSGNNSAPSAIDSAGNHVVTPGYANWVQEHWVAYRAANPQLNATPGNPTYGIPSLPDSSQCAECHGSDLLGGQSKVSCFGASYNGITCHPNADHKLGHPTGWGNNLSPIFHGFSSATGVKGNPNLSACGLCHAGTDAAGIIVSVSTAPSCLTTTPPDPRYAVSCHFSSPAVSPSLCRSCHVSMPPTDRVHSLHIREVTPQGGKPLCIDCHTNFTSLTSRIDPNHATLPRTLTNYPGVPVGYLGDPVGVVQSVFNAESGPAVYANTNGACSNVSCHGGQSVNWNTANSLTPTAFAGLTELNDSANCGMCHGPSGQYNSYTSGHSQTDTTGVSYPTLHLLHLAQFNPLTSIRIGCTDCHNTGILQNLHFANLSSAIPSTAYLTVSSPYVQYSQNGSCTTSCHTVLGLTFPANWISP